MFSVFAGRHYFDWIKLSPTCFHQVSRTFQGVVYKRPLSLISSGGLHPQKVSVLGCLKSLIEDSGGNFKKAVCKFQSFSYHHHHPLYYSKRFGQGLVEDYSILMVKTDITIHHSSIKSCESVMSMWHNVANPMLTRRLFRPVLLPHLKPGLSNQGAYRRCPASKLSTKAGNQDQPLKGMRRHVDIVRASVRRGMFKSM
jgi:hypothetical protein